MKTQTTMKTMVLALATAGMLATGGTAAAKGGALDGKSFTGTVGEKGKSTGDAELVTFKDGKFHSKACDAYGFSDGGYSAKTSGGVTTWEADTASAKEGKIHWRGTVRGDAVEATYTWTKP